jgi:hypothetical protein
MKAWMCIALVAACGRDGKGPVEKKQKTVEELKAAWGTKVQARLEKVVAAAKAASGAELGAPGDAQLALDFEWDDEKAHPNAFAVQLDDVLSATEPRPAPVKPDPAAEIEKAMAEGRTPVFDLGPTHPPFAFKGAGYFHVQKAKGLLGIPTAFASPEYVYDQFVNAKYVLVISPSDVTWPKATGMDFETGSARLRAVLIEIDTAKPLGGFEATAHNSSEVRVPEAPTGVNADLQKYDDSVQRKLDTDFLNELGKPVAKGIETRWPGTKRPLDLEM